MRLLAAALAGLILTATPANAAQSLPRYGVFIYSDFCWNSQSGDTSGFRVTLIRQGDGDRIEYEWTSEGPRYGALGYGAKFDPKTQRLTFSVNMNTGDGAQEFQDYSAEVSENELVLHSSYLQPAGAPEEIFHLPRVRDLSRKTPECR